MKHYLFLPLAVASLMLLAGCATGDYDDDDGPRVQSSTTTTEETRVHHPAATTTETRSIRTY